MFVVGVCGLLFGLWCVNSVVIVVGFGFRVVDDVLLVAVILVCWFARSGLMVVCVF